MERLDCTAVILAGGRGKRLWVLTKDTPKPALPFAGKHRLIDFTLSNCVHSGVKNIGIFTQYKASELSHYIGTGANWSPRSADNGITILSPCETICEPECYGGTADAVYKNAEYIEKCGSGNLLVLAGDHVYKMNYTRMLEYHRRTGAAVTISVVRVPWYDTNRFGIVSTDEDNNIIGFEEKPHFPKSNLASMGIYVFDWKVLKGYLEMEHYDLNSASDFGKDIIPAMLSAGETLKAFKFNGYWKDVGTIYSFWEASMELLTSPPGINMRDMQWSIMGGYKTHDAAVVRKFISRNTSVKDCLVTDGCTINGHANKSVISADAKIGSGSEIIESVIMPGAKIGKGARIYRSIIGCGTQIGDTTVIGGNTLYCEGVTAVGNNLNISSDIEVPAGFIVEDNMERNSRTIKLSLSRDLQTDNVDINHAVSEQIDQRDVAASLNSSSYHSSLGFYR